MLNLVKLQPIEEARNHLSGAKSDVKRNRRIDRRRKIEGRRKTLKEVRILQLGVQLGGCLERELTNLYLRIFYMHVHRLENVKNIPQNSVSFT
jgi:hypothetical protein